MVENAFEEYAFEGAAGYNCTFEFKFDESEYDYKFDNSKVFYLNNYIMLCEIQAWRFKEISPIYSSMSFSDSIRDLFEESGLLKRGSLQSFECIW